MVNLRRMPPDPPTRDPLSSPSSAGATGVHQGHCLALLEHAPLGVYLVDGAMKLQYVNAHAKPAFGDIDITPGRDFEPILRQIWPAAPATEVMAQFRHTLATGEPFHQRHFSAVRADRGSRYVYDFELHRLPLADGSFGVGCYFHDATAQVHVEETLRESEEQLRVTFDQAAIGIATAGVDGRFQQVNQRFAEIMGFTVEELRARTFLDITHPDDKAATQAARDQLLSGQIPKYVLEKRYVRRDGSTVWSRTTVTLIRDEAGEPVRMVGAVEDISSQRQADEDKGRLVALVEGSDDAILSKSLDSIIWTWNAGAERIFGYKAEEVVGKPVTILIPPGRIDEEAAILERIRRGDRVEHYETVRQRKDGKLIDVSLMVSPIRDAAGHIIGASKIARDISDDKRTRHELREVSIITEHLNEVARSLSTQLDLDKLVQLITDAGTRITRAQFGAFFYNVLDEQGASYMLYALSGVAREAFAKFPMPRATAVFAPTFRGEGVVRLGDVRKDPRFGHNAPYHGMPAGHLPVVSYLAVPVISRSGVVLGGLFFGHGEPDQFTARDEAIVVGVAAQAAAAMDNARLYQAEQQARATAENANRAKDHFLATLSHELRTPLTPVLGILSTLGPDQPVPAGWPEMVETMRRNVELEARLIDDLLDLTRISQGKLELHRDTPTVNAIIEAALATCIADLQHKQLALVREIRDGEREISADSARLTQILWNLLKNAIKFTPAGGTVTVRSRIDGPASAPQLILEVADTGIGLAPAMIGRLFNAFEQGDRTITQRYGGLGLGLAISKAIVEAHGGTLVAQSAGLDLGSTFTVTLPTGLPVPPVPGPALRAPAKTPVPPAAERRHKQSRLLFVEDHADTARVLAAILRRDGYDVLSASSVAEALAIAAVEATGQGIDLVVSDLGLPDGTGFQLMRELSDRYHLQGIALSGFGMEADREAAASAGFVQHITKPVDGTRLRAAIAEYFRGR